MQIDPSTISAYANRGELVRQAAQGQRTQRQFGANVLNRTQSALNFRSFLDRVQLSVQARAAKYAANVSETVTPSPTKTDAGDPTPTLPPVVTTNPALSATPTTPNYTKPQPAATPGQVIQPTETQILGNDKNTLQQTADVVGGSAVARPPREHHDEGGATRMPYSVLQEQLFSAFGTSSGDEGFRADLDLDGDGTIGLNDLNALNFAEHARVQGHDHNHHEHDGEHFDDAHEIEHDDHHAGAKPPATLPPVIESQPKPDAVQVTDTKHDLTATETVVGLNDAIDKAPAPEPEAATVLPKSVLQEQLFAAFGAMDGDKAYNATLDFDGDGIIGLNDLNHLLAQE